VNRGIRYAIGLASLAAVAAPVALHDAGACDPRGTICDPDNPENPDHVFDDGGAGVASPGGAGRAPLERIRAATRRFRDVDTAIAAGYVQFFGCVHEPLAGSMGTHFVNGELAGDTALDPARPEALMYDVGPDDQLELVGVEYVVFKEAWDAEHDEPPSLFGVPFIEVGADNRYGIPAFYGLHAWAWKSNPTGAFQDWNPRVICAGAEGHQHTG
jgi:hypothetical protein